MVGGMMGACVRHNKTIKLRNNNSRVSLVVHMQLVLNLRRVIEPSDFTRQNTVDRMEDRQHKHIRSTKFLSRLLGWMKELHIDFEGGFLVRCRWMKYPILQLIVAAKKSFFPPFLDIRRSNRWPAPFSVFNAVVEQ